MSDNPKITNIADARNRVTTNKKGDKRSGASIGKGDSSDAYERALRKQKGVHSPIGNGVKWYHYIQLLLLLGLVVWLMRACSL